MHCTLLNDHHIIAEISVEQYKMMITFSEFKETGEEVAEAYSISEVNIQKLRKTTKNLDHDSHVPVEIQTGHHLNTIQKA
jgi:hypothetical protein